MAPVGVHALLGGFVVNEPSDVPVIRTPDQRLRVFVSSTLRELEPERVAARRAIERLHLAPVMFELGARPHPPRELYRSYLAQSDVFVGVYWQQYGWIAPGEEISGLEDEYRLAPPEMPKLIYVKHPAECEERLAALLVRIRDDDTVSYKAFATAHELARLIEADLAIMLAERFDASRAARPNARAESTGEVLTVPSTDLIEPDAAVAKLPLSSRNNNRPAMTGLVMSIVGLLIVGLVVFLISGANQVNQASSESPTATTAATNATGPSPQSDAVGPPLFAVAASGSTAAFGETMIWDDGVEMAVSVPEAYTPSEFSTGAILPYTVAFTLTVTNNSDANVSVLPYSRVTSAGQVASPVVDITDAGELVGVSPQVALPPGQSVAWKEAWSLVDPNSISMLNTPSANHVDVTFTNLP